jgi:NAD(P)-dependent dehydrogenase (short-subunit alcohol dehydrogenase family)
MIMVNSDAVFHASARTAVYAASKAALRVLTAGLADRCRDRCASAATLSLGPLRDRTKTAQLQALAEKRGTDLTALTAEYLRRSNPFLVLNELIDLDACHRAVLHIRELGKFANGMVYRLDGGSAGSYV